MSLTIPKAYTEAIINTANGTNSTTTGFVSDLIKDERPLTRKTPKGIWRPPTPYYRNIWTGDNKTYSISLRWKARDSRVNPKYYTLITKSGYSDAHGEYVASMPSPSATFEDSAIIKARLKLKGMKVNIPQAIAERGQTIRLVGGNLRQLADMVRNVRRLKPGRLIRNDIMRESWFFDRWLELQYGWKPLISDCYGAVQALKEREAERGPPIVTVKANVQEKYRNETACNDSSNILIWDFTRIAETTHKGHLRLDFTQSDLPTGTLAELGITNPLELAWELLPWSFVADWFVPVGDYLSSLDATVGWDFKGGSFSVRSEMFTSARNFKIRPKTYYRVEEQSLSSYGKGRQFQLTRTTYADAPLPTLPSFYKFFKTGNVHVANGIALLMSAIIGGHRVR